VWCWAGPSVCACVIGGMPSSCRSAGESECVVLGRSVCLCVCVIAGMLSSCWSAGESECGVGQVWLFVRVSHEERRVAVGLPDSECVVLGMSVYVCVSYEERR